MAGMPMPEWYHEAKEKMGTIMSGPPPQMEEPPELEKILDLPHLFAEYCVKANDVLVHLFPRGGLKDSWVEAHYLPNCSNCGSQVGITRATLMKRCPRCGHTGLKFVPGRGEDINAVKFPKGILDYIKQAADSMWLGSISAEEVPELGAWVVQFQGAKTTSSVVGPEKFSRQFCTTLDQLLTK